MGKVHFLFLKSLLLVLNELSFLQGVLDLGSDSMNFRHFCDIP